VTGLSQGGWIKILSEFGPCAFFVFMFFVGLRIARHNQGLTPGQQKTQNIAFSVVWLSIFVFAFLSCLIYWKANFPSEHQIRGFIRNLQDPEFVSTRDNLFLKRHYGGYLDYDDEFRIIDPGSDDAYVTFVLAKAIDDRHPQEYRIPIKEEFYRGVLNINYDRSTGKMILVHGDEHSELEKVVFAAEGQGQNTNVSLLISALGATDPIIRENARKTLISIGPTVANSLGSAFAESSGYRGNAPQRATFLFEILKTLNAMPGLDSKSLNSTSACSISRAANDPLPDIAAQAQLLVQKQILGASPCKADLSPAHELTLESIVVRRSGRAGSPFWRFEIFLGDVRIAEIPEYDFSAAYPDESDHRMAPHKEVRFMANMSGGVICPPIKISGSKSVKVKVLAYRRGVSKPKQRSFEIYPTLSPDRYPVTLMNFGKLKGPNTPDILEQLDNTEFTLNFLM
jgi:hypothetical protein